MSVRNNGHVVQVPPGSRHGALSQIENLLESILDATSNGDELVIPYQSVRSLQTGPGQVSARRDGRQLDVVRFPGRTMQEAKKFGMDCYLSVLEFAYILALVPEALFRILELSHEALLSGNLITKRFGFHHIP